MSKTKVKLQSPTDPNVKMVIAVKDNSFVFIRETRSGETPGPGEGETTETITRKYLHTID